jgi:hypothetical protein
LQRIVILWWHNVMKNIYFLVTPLWLVKENEHCTPGSRENKVKIRNERSRLNVLLQKCILLPYRNASYKVQSTKYKACVGVHSKKHLTLLFLVLEFVGSCSSCVCALPQFGSVFFSVCLRRLRLRGSGRVGLGRVGSGVVVLKVRLMPSLPFPPQR